MHGEVLSNVNIVNTVQRDSVYGWMISSFIHL